MQWNSGIKSTISGAPSLVDRVFAVHAGSKGFDYHRRHMSKRFFRSNRPGYPHPVCSELENSGIRVAVGDCSVTERGGSVCLIKPAKLYTCTQTHYKQMTDARRRVCAAMVPYRWATRGTSFRELDYTHKIYISRYRWSELNIRLCMQKRIHRKK